MRQLLSLDCLGLASVIAPVAHAQTQNYQLSLFLGGEAETVAQSTVLLTPGSSTMVQMDGQYRFEATLVSLEDGNLRLDTKLSCPEDADWKTVFAPQVRFPADGDMSVESANARWPKIRFEVHPSPQ